MSLGTPFLLGPADCDALHELRDRAARAPVDIRDLTERISRPTGKAVHMRQMTAQTIELPFGYAVTYSVEFGHPIGTCRHMSMSSPRPDRVPRPEALWLVAVELGFVGELEQCAVWPEALQGHGIAVNVVQPITAPEGRPQ